MDSWQSLSPVRLKPAGAITAAFLGLGMVHLRHAAQYVCDLPYGRNSCPGDPLIVLGEQRGTCSTKHALLRRLAIEQELDLALVLGMYEMTEHNTPGVGPVLQRHNLTGLLEAHCYLRTGDRRIDVTRACSEGSDGPIAHFIHEEEIQADQIGEYKTGMHRKFLEKWIADNDGFGGLSLTKIWAIREECIAQLSQ
jgi:hypothetical protein